MHCGRKPSLIVGGYEVTSYSIPWQVSLVKPTSDLPFCGGTLISDRHVLTAAHCLTKKEWPKRGGWPADVIVGQHRHSTSDGTRHKACRYVNHPQYLTEPAYLDNDIAILHLEKPVTIGTRVVPACLPKSSMGGDFLVGEPLTVSGWGKTGNGWRQGDSAVLKSVNVPVVSHAQCQASFNSHDRIISDAKQICAGGTKGLDSCDGDSGGKQ